MGPTGPSVAAALGPLLPHPVPLFSTHTSEAAQHKDPATNYIHVYESIYILATYCACTLLQTTTAHTVNKAASSTSHAPSHAHAMNFMFCIQCLVKSQPEALEDT